MANIISKNSFLIQGEIKKNCTEIVVKRTPLDLGDQAIPDQLIISHNKLPWPTFSISRNLSFGGL